MGVCMYSLHPFALPMKLLQAHFVQGHGITKSVLQIINTQQNKVTFTKHKSGNPIEINVSVSFEIEWWKCEKDYAMSGWVNVERLTLMTSKPNE